MALSSLANPKPQADVHVHVTDDLPKIKTEIMLWYNGICTITNTGEIAFPVFTEEVRSDASFRFYREGNEKQQRVEGTLGNVRRWREEDRNEVRNCYDLYIGNKQLTRTLQPSESMSIKIMFAFSLPYGAPGDFYKGEMYLGGDTWIPVHITPTLGWLLPVTTNQKRSENFFYSPEGTNQYLYVKVDDKFKRVGEMKLGSKAKKDEKEDIVTFETPDGATKRFTRDQAREIVREREHERKNQRE